MSKRILMWTHAEPDAPSGSPAILTDLLQRFGPEVVAVACEARTPRAARRDVQIAAPIHRWSLPNIVFPFRRGDRVRAAVRRATGAALLAWGFDLARRYQPTALITILRDTLWVGTALAITRALDIPLVVLVHDAFVEQEASDGPAAKRIAQWLEERVVRERRTAVLNETMQELYEEKYGAHTVIVRQMSNRASAGPMPSAGDRRVVGFSGAIYANNSDSLKSLGTAVADTGLKLRVFTGTERARVAALVGDADILFERNFDDLLTGLGQCGLLYLPLSFAGDERLPPGALRYSLPTKSMDYLIAGTEILVHAPHDYDVSRFFRRTGSAHVLSAPGVDPLREWLGRWARGEIPPIPDAVRRRALDEFSPERNFPSLVRLFDANP